MFEKRNAETKDLFEKLFKDRQQTIITNKPTQYTSACSYALNINYCGFLVEVISSSLTVVVGYRKQMEFV